MPNINECACQGFSTPKEHIFFNHIKLLTCLPDIPDEMKGIEFQTVNEDGEKIVKGPWCIAVAEGTPGEKPRKRPCNTWFIKEESYKELWKGRICTNFLGGLATNDITSWRPFVNVRAFYKKHGGRSKVNQNIPGKERAGIASAIIGLGFGFTPDSTILFTDFDSILTEADGGWLVEPWAARMILEYGEGLAELSTSSTGLHIYTKYDNLGAWAEARQQKGGQLEVYWDKRFAVVTGQWVQISQDGDTYRAVRVKRDASHPLPKLSQADMDALCKDAQEIFQASGSQADDTKAKSKKPNHVGEASGIKAQLIKLGVTDPDSYDDHVQRTILARSYTYPWSNLDDDKLISTIIEKSKTGSEFADAYKLGIKRQCHPSMSETWHWLMQEFLHYLGPSSEERIKSLMFDSAIVSDPTRLEKYARCWDTEYARLLERKIQEGSFRRTKTDKRVTIFDKSGVLAYTNDKVFSDNLQDRTGLQWNNHMDVQVSDNVSKLLYDDLYRFAGHYLELRRSDGACDGVVQDKGKLKTLIGMKALFFACKNEGQPQESCKPIATPDSVVQMLLERWQYVERMRKLEGICNGPHLREDGTIITQTGYDEKTSLYCCFDEKLMKRKVSLKPTDREIKNARRILDYYFQDFPFETDVDKSVCYSALFSALCHRSVPAVPAHVFSATALGTGKSTLCELVGLIATGTDLVGMSLPDNKDEFDKTLHSVLLTAKPIVFVDNVLPDTPVNFASLATCVTQAHWSKRILGKSAEEPVNTNVLFLLSGNYLQLTQDMTDRALRCHLDSGYEDAGKRAFKIRDIYTFTRRNRGLLLWAALTLMQAARDRVKGYVKTEARKNFSLWADIVVRTCLFLGLPDPAESKHAIKAMDENTIKRARILQAWNAVYGCTEKQAKQVFKEVHTQCHETYVELKDSIYAMCPNVKAMQEISQTKFTQILGQLREFADGKKLEIRNKSNRTYLKLVFAQDSSAEQRRSETDEATRQELSLLVNGTVFDEYENA